MYHFIRQPIARADKTPVAYELLVRGSTDQAHSILEGASDAYIRQIDLDALEVAIALAPGCIPHHVNCSRQSVSDWDYFARLGQALKDGINPKMVVVEVNEAIAPDTPVLFRLTCIRDLGYPLFLDDFGTFHSNNLMLSKLRPTGLKIDGEIVKKVADLYECDFNIAIVEKDLRFCQEHGLTCIVEHVENDMILQELQLIAHRVGFSGLLFQGWAIGKGVRVEV